MGEVDRMAILILYSSAKHKSSQTHNTPNVEAHGMQPKKPTMDSLLQATEI